MASPSSPAQVQVLHYHGQSFVVGLLWHPLSSLTGYMREARQFGREQAMDIVAVRRTDSIIQAGFAARSAGAVKGMYSLAAVLAGQLGDSWIAAWRIAPNEDRYGLVAVFEGAVIPGSDRVGSAEDIQRKVEQLLGRSIHFAETFLPEEFQRGGRPLEIEALLEPRHLRREHRLRPLVFGLSPGERIRVAGVGILLIASLIGWQQWDAYSSRQIREAAIAAEQVRLAKLAELNARAPTEQSLQALEHPWATRPSVDALVEGCQAAIDGLPLSIAGWVFVTAMCNGELLLATYKRTGNSTAAGFIQAAHGYFADSPAFFDQGNSATLRSSLSLPLAGDETLLNASDALAGLTSWLHERSLKPTLKEIPFQVSKPPALPGQPESAVPALPDWKHFELTFSSDLPPAALLRDVPGTGFRLNSITTQLQNYQLSWSVTGDLYAR